MADVSKGSVSTLPGSVSKLPAGTMCDDHPDRPAVKRVQGETDSFGCEYNDMCQECYTKYKEYVANADTSGKCDWCKQHADKLISHRDIEEGSCGRVYDVCLPCIDAERAQWRYYLDDDDDWEC